MEAPTIAEVSRGSDSQRVLLFVRGYLSEGPRGRWRDVEWLTVARRSGWRGDIYQFRWDASESAAIVARALWAMTRFRGDWKLIAAGTVASTVHHWLSVRRCAEETGKQYFVPYVERCFSGRDVTVVAHSAGARLVFSGLLHAKEICKPVSDVIFLGAAVSRGHRKDWAAAVSRINGVLLNLYNPYDWILTILYRLGQLTTRDACGRYPILLEHPRIRNYDVSRIVGKGLSNHESYHKALPVAFSALKKAEPGVEAELLSKPLEIE